MIFYFSGAGNSLAVAKRIADATHDKLVNMADCVAQNTFEFDVQ